MAEFSGPTSHSYFSQRLRLHYVDWGNPDAPPVLLVHGGRDHCRNWDWVARALRKNYHVIAVDLRGHFLWRDGTTVEERKHLCDGTPSFGLFGAFELRKECIDLIRTSVGGEVGCDGHREFLGLGVLHRSTLFSDRLQNLEMSAGRRNMLQPGVDQGHHCPAHSLVRAGQKPHDPRHKCTDGQALDHARLQRANHRRTKFRRRVTPQRVQLLRTGAMHRCRNQRLDGGRANALVFQCSPRKEPFLHAFDTTMPFVCGPCFVRKSRQAAVKNGRPE